jgi:small conductance mechanosensitive channel
MDIDIMNLLTTVVLPFAGRVVGAIVLWIVGRLLIGAVQRVLGRALTARKIDITLIRYASSSLGVLLTILLGLAILSLFGIETASFAGILAAAGVAIGMAWSGLLSNFAAGVFLVVLRPFKVGDAITAGGVTGSVVEIGLFGTALDTPDGIRNVVGNSKIFSDNIQNYSANPFRRVDLKVQIAHGVDVKDAMERLQKRMTTVSKVLTTPAPEVEIVELNTMGIALTVRGYAHHDDYWTVYFEGYKAIVGELSSAGYPVPEEHRLVRQV